MMSTSIQWKEVNTTSEAKQTNVLGNKESLKTDMTKNIGGNTKDECENSKEKLKDNSNTYKETDE